jgi:2-polyprenyl-6-methoxyphenol hydroxylase-like FAD-dependent oxidoreductase
VKLQEDIVYTADLIIGADGIYSKLH